MIGEKYYTHIEMDKVFAASEFANMGLARPSLYPKITIHSSNGVGAKEMIAILDGYGIKAEWRPYETYGGKQN